MKKSITIVFIANIINLFFSVIISFILPKYLSIESYGYYKIFQLYVNYVGIAHLGFSDGVYLKYGGKNLNDICADEILDTTSSLRNMQLLLTFIFLVVAVAFNNTIAICLSISCFPINMVSYYKNLFQATGKFKNYGVILAILPILACLIDLILIFQINSDQSLCYIMVTVISNLLVYAYLEYSFYKTYRVFYFFHINKKLIKENIAHGFPLMIGNLASLLVTSIDRWFIQLLMEVKNFSYYSFAVSVESVFNVCTSALTTTLYNYLCQISEREKIIRIKSFCIIIATYLISIAFPVKFVVNYWIEKYIPALNCIFILISAHMFYFVIRAIYVNLYKANGKQKHYLYQVIKILFVAVISNIIAYFGVDRSIEAIAVASLFTAFIWYCICYHEYKYIRGTWGESIQVFCCIISYLVCGLKVSNAGIGCLVYLMISTLIIYIFNKKVFIEFWENIINYILLFKRRLFNEKY